MQPEDFTTELFLNSAAEAHLSEPLTTGAFTLRQLARREKFQQEEALYEKAGLPYVVPELREGLGEMALAADKKLPQLLEDADLRGSLHNHSTYSDGNHSIREMATWLRDHGYEYLGLCDHSQAAHYANGLSVERVRQQHQRNRPAERRAGPVPHLQGHRKRHPRRRLARLPGRRAGQL